MWPTKSQIITYIKKFGNATEWLRIRSSTVIHVLQVQDENIYISSFKPRIFKS